MLGLAAARRRFAGFARCDGAFADIVRCAEIICWDCPLCGGRLLAFVGVRRDLPESSAVRIRFAGIARCEVRGASLRVFLANRPTLRPIPASRSLTARESSKPFLTAAKASKPHPHRGRFRQTRGVKTGSNDSRGCNIPTQSGEEPRNCRFLCSPIPTPSRVRPIAHAGRTHEAQLSNSPPHQTSPFAIIPSPRRHPARQGVTPSPRTTRRCTSCKLLPSPVVDLAGRSGTVGSCVQPSGGIRFEM